MTLTRITEVKKEIRVLGVAVRRKLGYVDIVGIIYRGSAWLDGVLRNYSINHDITRAIADMLNLSPHKGQVRVIIINQLPIGITVSIEELKIATAKPIILIGESVTGYGIGKKITTTIMRKTIWKAGLPEALMVAYKAINALWRSDIT